MGDIREWIKTINSTLSFFKQKVQILESPDCLNKIPYDFRVMITKSIKFFETSTNELRNILQELPEEVRQDHVQRTYALGTTAQRLDVYYGKLWNEQNPYKKLGDNFKLVEFLYIEGRDIMADMIDLINLSERLQDFVGKKILNNGDIIEVHPNIWGIGINFNNLFRKFKRIIRRER